ncbi:MAG: hypothetical protein DRN66_01480 [Candidatus Nanohalarchaeota archaeon]|nr:MAG: hypothetical protein DRN66_01480 [Candidatus Nanohaloarchaeota archaeon]
MLNKKIIRKIDASRLSEKLKENIKTKYIESEQWYAQSNLNYTCIFSSYISHTLTEITLLNKHAVSIAKLPPNLIFYGLGFGYSEIELLKLLIKKNKKIDVIGIDIQEDFITGFIQSLNNICYEDKKYNIDFVGIKGLFQELQKTDFDILKGRKAHIIFGNTIGNFKYEKIFGILNKYTNKTDILLMGFQTDNFFEKKVRQYQDNAMLNSFIKKAINTSKDKTLIWKVNEKESQIEVWMDDILIGYSKKTNPVEMIKTAEKYGFKNIEMFNENSTAIQIYEKI